MKLDRWIFKKLKCVSRNHEKIISLIGIIGGGIWCAFTLLDLSHGPYWAVSLRLFFLNGIYFLGKFLLGFYVLLRSVVDFRYYFEW